MSPQNSDSVQLLKQRKKGKNFPNQYCSLITFATLYVFYSYEENELLRRTLKDQKRNNGCLPASLLVLNTSSKPFCKLQSSDLQVTCNREQPFRALWAVMPDTPRICGPSGCNNSLLVALADGQTCQQATNHRQRWVLSAEQPVPSKNGLHASVQLM